MITQFEIDLAIMAGRAYQTTRAQNGINWFPTPVGWTEFSHVPSSTYPTTSGFEASAFQKGNAIVISFAGTNSNDLTGDIAANIGLATGFGSVQLLQAAEYYLQVQVANPNATITFTGHSLGGGLAALMGVFFGKQAVTFDQAPFALSATWNLLTPNVAAQLKADLLGRGYSEASLQGLTEFLALRDVMGGIPNADLVTGITVSGELLFGVPYNIANRIGLWTNINNNATGVSGVDLHSQALLTAFLQSMQTAPSQRALNDVTYKLSDLLGMIFDGRLYAFSTDTANTTNRNFLERLVQHEAGIGTTLPADRMVTRFTADLWKLAQEGGLTMSEGTSVFGNPLNNVSKALIAFAMQMYYENTANALDKNKELFTDLADEGTGSGGIRFDRADVAGSLEKAKGYQLYFREYLKSNAFTDEERRQIDSRLPAMREWYVQAGPNGMEATDTFNHGAFFLGGSGTDTMTGGSGNDLLVGNAGDDILNGGSGADILLGQGDNDQLDGGIGNDTLIGGQGNDTLRGGTGFDTYIIGSNDGADTIEDTDGKGVIKFDGQILGGALQRLGDRPGVFHSADGTITLTKNGTDVVVTGSGPLTIKTFSDGEFGIRLVDLPTFGEATRTEFLKVEYGQQVGADPVTGAPIYQLVYAPFFDDNANDTRNTSSIGGLTVPIGDDNNLIEAGGGDDFLLSGTGDDQLYGGAGSDWIYGGLGNDRIFGGSGDDQLMGDNVAVSTNGGNDYLDGGDGNDFVQGGAGRDIVLGGAGNDLLNGDEFAGDNSGGFNDWLDGGMGDDDLQGGAGSDVLIGGADNDFLLGDRTQYQGGTPEQGGHDELDGGTGNDQLFGVYGNDVLSGGDGKDLLNGQDGSDVLDGGSGDDWLSGDLRLIPLSTWGTDQSGFLYDTNEYRAVGGDDVLFGEEGDDFLTGGEGSDTLNGGDDNDVLFGGYNMGVVSPADPLYWTLFTAAGNDWLDAGVGNDTVFGGIGTDTLSGGEGDDRLIGEGGDDVLEGGTGNDVLYGDYFEGEYAPSNPFYADIMALSGGNTLDGGAGDDELHGGSLADRLIGGDGNDRLDGGSGVDILLGDAGDDRILDDDPDVAAVSDNETLDGGDGNDYLESWWGDDVLLGGRGDDVLLSRAGTDSLIGGEGNDCLVWDNTTSTTTQVLYGGVGDDVYVINTAGAVVMEMAGEGIDLVITNEVGYVLPDTIENFGGSGIGNTLDNLMVGGNLEGREGNDTLIGGGRLDGGAGDDLLKSGGVAGGMSYFDGAVSVGPGGISGRLQPLPQPKPTEPNWYLEMGYPNTRFQPGNTYVFGAGYGHDTVQEMDETFNSPFWQNEDTVEFLSGVAPSDVIWERIGNDLELSINGGADRLTIQSFYDLAFYRGNYSYGGSGFFLPPEGYEVQVWGWDVQGFSTYKAYSRIERFTFADGTVWMADHFGTPLLGDYRSDTYQFGRGSGHAAILDFDFWQMDGSNRGTDTLRIGAGVTPDDLEVFQNGNDLILAITDTDDYVTVQSFFASVSIAPPVGSSYSTLPYQLEQVQFEDGTVWTVGDLYGRLNTSSDRFSTIRGTANADSLSGDIRNNVIYGLDGNDSIWGGGGHDALYGGPGNDYLQGGGSDHDGGDYFEGGPGNDSILGYDGGNTYVFQRGDGQDTIGNYDSYHGATDTLILPNLLPTDITVRQSFFGNYGTHNLELVVNGSADSVTLGDWVEWRNSDLPYNPEFEMERIQFADGTLWTTADLIAHAQGVTRIGSDADESFNGSVFNDVLQGSGGNDALFGSKGNDVLNGGAGDDYLEGSYGSDTYVFGRGDGVDWIGEDLYWNSWWGTPKPSDVDVIRLTTDVTTDSLTLHADQNNNLVLQLIGSNDILTIYNYFGREQNEVEQIVFADGTVWDSASIRTRATGMEIVGTESEDVLTGTLLDDVLTGLGGADILEGAEGDDLLIGGTGDDTYVFNLGDGFDTIEDVGTVDEGNCLAFGEGIALNDLTFTPDQTAQTLTIQVGSSGTDQLILTTLDPTNANGLLAVETLAFADGSTMALADVLAPVVNQPPTVANPIADQTVPEDAAFSFTIPTNTFTDPDTGSSLTYRATLADGTALPIWLTFDPATGAFSGTPTNNDVGTLSVIVTAADASGLSATSAFGLTIQNVNDAPTIANAIADQTVPEDSTAIFTVPPDTFADQDLGDTLAYSASLADGSPLPSWLVFDAVTHTFSGIPDDAQVGSLALAVTATDTGNLSVSDVITLTVQNVNDAPVVETPLVDQMGAEDEPFSVAVPAGTFADEDAVHGDTLSYRASLSDGTALPTWLSFDATTRTFSGTPGAGTAGIIQIAVTATDTGELTATDVFALTISGPLPKTFIGTVGNDVLVGGRGNDTMSGLGGNDTLSGREGNDWLDGGAGSDMLVGGMGDDIYVVDATGDVVTELVNEGIDTVRTSLSSYALGANVENLTLMGGSTSVGIGNALNNTLLGDTGANVLSGGAGNDILRGGAGIDVLDGGIGADILQGGTGDDVLAGGTGNDWYQSSRGDGRDVIRDKDTTVGNNDRLAFGTTINPLDLILERQANNLRLRVYGTGDQVSIDSWYGTGTANHIETIQAGNGQVLLDSQVDQLIQAMAGFTQQNGYATWDQAVSQDPQGVQAVLVANGWE